MRKMWKTAAVATALILAALPASAHHDGTAEQPTLRTERVYFKCLNGDKVQTVHYLNGALATWNTTAPTQSVQQGAGCGHYENLLTYNNGEPNPHDVTWAGTFTGNLDQITVEAHNVYVGAQRVLRPFFLSADLWIDGEKVYTSGGDPIRVTPVTSSTGVSEKFLLTFTGIDLKTEHGDGAQEREIMVKLSSWNETQSAWVWDTTEVPSGLTFNPAAPEALKLPVG